MPERISKNKQSLYRFIVIALMMAAVIIGVYVYYIKNPQGIFSPQQPGQSRTEGTGDDRTSIEFQGRILKVNSDFPRGVIGGTVLEDPDIQHNAIIIKADIAQIYPKTPIASKNITISTDNADIILGGGNYKTDKSYALADITVGTNVSIGLVESETNRDIFTKDHFQAVRVNFFK